MTERKHGNDNTHIWSYFSQTQMSAAKSEIAACIAHIKWRRFKSFNGRMNRLSIVDDRLLMLTIVFKNIGNTNTNTLTVLFLTLITQLIT